MSISQPIKSIKKVFQNLTTVSGLLTLLLNGVSCGFKGNVSVSSINVTEGMSTTEPASVGVPSPAPSPSPVASGLVMLYDALLANGGTAPFDQGLCSGPWTDLSSSGLSGLLFHNTSSPLSSFSCTSGDGWIGTGTVSNPYGINFDGFTDFVQLPSTNLDFSSGLTIEVWAKVASLAPVWSRFMELGNAGPSDTILFARETNLSVLALGIYRAGSGGNAYSVPGAVVSGAIQQYAATLTFLSGNLGTAAFYVNGASIPVSGSSSVYMPRSGITRSTNYIGWNSFGNNLYYGNMYIVRVYGRPLSPAEILQNCQTQESQLGLSVC